MILTRAFIHSHKTERGGGTLSQLQAIGVRWKPKPGGRDRVVGREISDEQAEIFKAKIPAHKARAAFDIAEAARKAALPPECHLAPYDDQNWSQWHQVEGEYGLHWEREMITPSTPL